MPLNMWNAFSPASCTTPARWPGVADGAFIWRRWEIENLAPGVVMTMPRLALRKIREGVASEP
jgi:hypothetical protein